ncbi:prolyl oligopeptidase family serine peptidase [Sphingobacterium sp. SGG-5]|uniref:S9 family peptidase n=1 Tax=Sphingobacterium sp. SGG-5 TaxID=2710881 RepID=UPI0013EDA878|nr:prolyl oligopeptidase family serine peptidase [Sphingobacterium sp. SGG-5]NGM61780.1 prolyl oligopeptidase family serine peptidase [Sphingobacterium sp. SGG-5]
MKLSSIRFLSFLTCLLFFCSAIVAQEHPNLNKLLSIPYIGNIEGATSVDRLAFTVNEQGRRNVYIADGPDYTIKKVTHFDEDDAQEITSLSISNDGNWVVFARGGDHGSNSAAVAVNPASLVHETNIEIFSLSLTDNKLYKVGNGDFPVLHPNNRTVTYLRRGKVWSSPLGREKSGKQLFAMRGIARNIQWSPDGTQLTFVSRRGAYSFIGVYQNASKRLKWVSPSFYTDAFPQWSPDGKQIAFVRREPTGVANDSLFNALSRSWSIMVADLISDKVEKVYASPTNKRAGYPRIGGGVNLRWKNSDYITFMSYEDGWPHLYRLDAKSKAIKQLTKGNFTVEDMAYDSKGKYILFAANTGKDKFDFERSHVGRVSVDDAKVDMLTEGEGIESAPFFYYGDRLVGFKSSTYDKPVQPKVYDLRTAKQRVVADELFKGVHTGFVKPTQVFITSEDGIKFSSQYYKPQGNRKNLPAVIYIHGGPRRQMYLGWHHRDYYFYDYTTCQYLVQQGFAVLSVNYRMGTGYGYDFQHPKSAGSLGASEYKDILAAGKWLAGQADVNPEKVGVFGGSYGGYLTAMALAKNSDIFKAGVDIHGVHNRLKDRDPNSSRTARLNWDSSPSRWVDTWKSPVLLIHGDDDGNVAFWHSIDLYSRLKVRKVDVEVLVLPDENHHWQLFENLVKVKAATVDFLVRKLK